jgi:hypothetical protein
VTSIITSIDVSNPDKPTDIVISGSRDKIILVWTEFKEPVNGSIG